MNVAVVPWAAAPWVPGALKAFAGGFGVVTTVMAGHMTVVVPPPPPPPPSPIPPVPVEGVPVLVVAAQDQATGRQMVDNNIKWWICIMIEGPRW